MSFENFNTGLGSWIWNWRAYCYMWFTAEEYQSCFQHTVRLMSPSLPWGGVRAVTNTVRSQLLGHCWCFVSYSRDIHSVLVLRTPQIVHSGLIGWPTVKWILRQICLYDYLTSVLFLCCRYSLKPNDQILAEDKHKEL